MKQRWKITLGIVAGLAVVFLITWFSPLGRFILTGGLSMEEQAFDSVQWKAVHNQDHQQMRVRLLMLDDLMENQLKTGTDSAVVREMLGAPEAPGLCYGLGTLTPGMEPLYLTVQLDAAGKVERLHIETGKKLKK